MKDIHYFKIIKGTKIILKWLEEHFEFYKAKYFNSFKN